MNQTSNSLTRAGFLILFALASEAMVEQLIVDHMEKVPTEN